MKTIAQTLFFAILWSASLHAQIPNSNFENWTIADNGTDSLIGWSSSNAIVISPVISLYKDDDSYEGDFAANLVTAPFGFAGYSTIGVLVNGQATFNYGGGGGGANVDYDSGGGTPIAYKPTEVRGYYKTTTLTPGDLPSAKVLLSKYNSSSNQRDTISYTEYNFIASDTYKPFAIPLEDLMPGVMPDTITTIFYSSNPELVNQFGVWSNLFLDSISLFPDNTTAVENIASRTLDLKVFPNPSGGALNIENLTPKAINVEVYNLLGVMVQAAQPIAPNHVLNIDLSHQPSGVYYVKSTNSPGSITKFVLTK